MKNQKGITLTSLVIYIIGMVVVIGIVANLTTFFYKNINKIDDSNISTDYTKFTSIFLTELNQQGNTIIEAKTYEKDSKKISYIIFSSGNQYTYKEENKSIYKNNIKFCSQIDNCEFSYIYQDSKYKISIELIAGNINLTGDNKIVYTM